MFLKKEQLSLDVIKQCRVRCPKALDKQRVLKDMILPNCEKLGQTIIFVQTRELARQLHQVVRYLADCSWCTAWILSVCHLAALRAHVLTTAVLRRTSVVFLDVVSVD